MGLFDFLKINKPANALSVVKTQNTHQEKTLEQRNEEYFNARQIEIERLRAAYDFTTVDGVNKIPVPCKEVNSISSPTGRVEYYLRGACFAKHWDEGRIDVALACLRKAQELMYISDMIWKKQDFMRLVYYLKKAGNEEEAERELERIEQFFSSEKKRISDKIFDDLFRSMKLLETDLAEVGTCGVLCEKCAKYKNRIYSVHGKDKRFPRFPADFHIDCGLKPYPFVFGVSEPTFNCRNVVKYSNRPFVDDRTPEDVAKYSEWEQTKEQAAADQRRREKLHREYDWLQNNVAELCPKSISAYSRMKNQKTEKYLQICKIANKNGFMIVD